MASPNTQSQEEQELDQLVQQAVEAAAKGEDVGQLLEVMLASLPAPAKEKLRKKFSAALAKRGLKQPPNEVADIPSRGALARIREALAIPARQAVERVMALLRSRPDIAKAVQQAGEVLARNGVAVERIQIREADLGQMAPVAGTAKAQPTQGTGRT